MQFLSENRLNRRLIIRRFDFLKTESELNFDFLHISTGDHSALDTSQIIFIGNQP